VDYGCRVLPSRPAGGPCPALARAGVPSRPAARPGTTLRTGGAIIHDTLWDAAVVTVDDDIIITNGAVLTVASGVRVEFAGYFGVLVEDGALQAAGKVDDRVVWTSAHPESFDETQATAGSWNGITFLNVPADTPESYLHWCILQHAKAVPGLGLDPGGPRVGGRALDGAGGALRVVGRSRLEVTGCIFRDNCADRGGALALHYGAAPLVANSLMIDNVGWSRAGAVFVGNAHPVFVHDTLASNRCVNPEIFDRTAGAVDHYHSKPRYLGCVVYGNETNHHEGHEILEPRPYYTAYCDIAGVIGGEGCLDADPAYILHGEGRYGQRSPCREAGSFLMAEPYLPETDLDGFPRREGVEVDMGCYEFTPSSAAGDATPATLCAPRAHPNPCNPRTTVAFRTTRAGPVRLALHDPRGRLVRMLIDGELPAGEHAVAWDGLDDGGRPAASGSYVIRLDGGGAVRTGTLTLVR
jgi:hypothetical protein